MFRPLTFRIGDFLKKPFRRVWGLAVFVLFLSACDFSPGQMNTAEWNARWLGPLAQNRTEAKTIIGDNTRQFDFGLDVEDLGLPVGKELELDARDTVIGPIAFKISNPFEKLRIPDEKLEIVIENDLPVAVLEKTKIVLKHQDEDEPILDYTLEEQIREEGGQLVVAIPPEARKALMSDEWVFTLKPLELSGTTKQILIQEDQQLSFTFKWNDLNYRVAIARNNGDLQFFAKGEFNLKGEVIKSQPVNGTFTLFVKNRLPLALQMQAYFLGEDQKQVLDSLFVNKVDIQSPPINQEGKTKAVKASKLSVKVNEAKIQRIRNAEFVRAFFRMTATGNDETVTIQGRDFIQFKLVGNFNAKVSGN